MKRADGACRACVRARSTKKKFIKHSKAFSDTLKLYFKEEATKEAVFECGEVLRKGTQSVLDTLAR